VGVDVEDVVAVGVMLSRVSMDVTFVPRDWAIWVAFIPWLRSWRAWALNESWTVSVDPEVEDEVEVDPDPEVDAVVAGEVGGVGTDCVETLEDVVGSS
jgi:hypothetical protein